MPSWRYRKLDQTMTGFKPIENGASLATSCHGSQSQVHNGHAQAHPFSTPLEIADMIPPSET